jgi:hypothetical protein
MALHYCSTHHRCWSMARQRWMAVPSELIARITEFSQRFFLPEFEVIDARCDQCDAVEELQ